MPAILERRLLACSLSYLYEYKAYKTNCSADMQCPLLDVRVLGNGGQGTLGC